MQKGPSSDVGVPLCGYKKAGASAGSACVVGCGEGAEGGFFFDDEYPVAGREGEVGYIFGVWDEDALGVVSISWGNEVGVGRTSFSEEQSIIWPLCLWMRREPERRPLAVATMLRASRGTSRVKARSSM